MSEVPIVTRVIEKSKRIHDRRESLLDIDEDILSGNLVTGYSLNFPIFQTCQPTKVCISTCYFAKGMTAFNDSLAKQLRLYRFMKLHWEYAAWMLAKAYRKKRMTFLRWNGGGDLFPESVMCLNLLIEKLPDIVVWIPTRRLDMARLINHSPTVFPNISLDRSSMYKLEKYESMQKNSHNHFYSYQYDKGEKTDPASIDARISLIYFDGDRQPRWLGSERDARICPRTYAAQKDNTCVECRKCFNGHNTQHRLAHS